MVDAMTYKEAIQKLRQWEDHFRTHAYEECAADCFVAIRTAVEDEIQRLRAMIEALENLTVSYRLQCQPPEKCLKVIRKFHKAETEPG